MTRYFLQVIQKLQLVKAKASKSGFTLVELLIATIMASIMITVLLGVVIDILNTNQRETSRTETQQEMQRALDYISADLRASVYIYDGECFEGTNPNCEGIFGNNKVQIPNNSVPILAFWRLKELPDGCNPDSPGRHAACATYATASRTYSFVAYFLSRENPNNLWKGQARITRFEFNQFRSDGTAINPNYVDPGLLANRFLSWTPGGTVTPTASVNGQSYDVLVDFADDTFNQAVSCPSSNYVLTPNNTTLTSAGFTDVRSFYACVKIPDGNNPDTRLNEFNQDVLISIRGNAAGKPGVRENSEQFLPVLQTQVLRRGVFGKRPN